MITKWTVSNFKSITKETTLDLAPITLLAGPNSSGKSTVLQTILLVSQTLAHKVDSRSVVLNGVFTRLGQFDDLKSNGGESDQIVIGWECRPAEDGQSDVIENTRFPDPFMMYGRRVDSIKEISCKVSFDANPGGPALDLYQLQPRLFLFTMSLSARAEDNTDRSHELTVSRSQMGSAKITNLKIEEPDNEIVRASLDYDIVLDQDSVEEIREEFATAEPVGCILRHFLPNRFSIRINTVEELSKWIYMVMIGGDRPVRYRRLPFMGRELVIPNELANHLKIRLEENFAVLFDGQAALIQPGLGISFQDFMERIRALPLKKRNELRRLLAEWTELPKIIENILRSELKAGASEHQLLQYRPPDDLMNASAYLGMLFSNAVKYLGPLRDEPKPLYPLAAHADPTDVGLLGEMTAAVLNLHRQRKIRYIPSSAFGKSPFEPTPIVRSLEAAVTDWLRYLGVAETVHSIDKGKLGHELKITLTEGGPTHDLTHVGVGVSQVLPILVMSLLAGRDTTLIFEQPELHLHPKVQTRLGDFFLSIALSGKQCLIETHSEYLINRLRYRAAAEEKTSRVANSLKMYFVEKIDGASNFREVKVNEYGAILDWPEGFFDQSQREAEDILRAAMAKKQKLKIRERKPNA